MNSVDRLTKRPADRLTPVDTTMNITERIHVPFPAASSSSFDVEL